MTLLLPAGLGALLLAAPVPGPVQAALQDALALPRSRAVVVGWSARLPEGCGVESAEVARGLSASGRVAVALHGRTDDGLGCSGSGWARVQVFSQVYVTRRDVEAGERFDAALVVDEREVLPGRDPLRDLPVGAVAARPLPAGTLVEAHHVRAALPAPGSALTVELHSGALVVEAQGTAVPCGREAVCARLATGKRVEGRLQGDRLIVEASR